MPTMTELKELQALPLEIKIAKTKQRIREWVREYEETGVYISFSGGKDSTVLMDIVRKMYPEIPAVFVDTGLEYPSIRRFVKTFENVVWLRPKMNFKEVIIKYGYPVIGKEVAENVWVVRHSKTETYVRNTMERFNGTLKRKDGQLSIYNCQKYKFLLDAPFELSSICCKKMKKDSVNEYEKRSGRVPIMATMAEESRLRKSKWLQYGCNSFSKKRANSAPMSFWTEQDVLTYIHTYGLQIADAYGDVIVKNKSGIQSQENIADLLRDYRGCEFCTTGCKRTGCIFCLFGITQDLDRVVKLKQQEPKLADYMLRGGEWNENGIWQPSNEGLGFKFVIDWLNEYGNLNIQY